MANLANRHTSVLPLRADACRNCLYLVLDYIEASNRLVELRRQQAPSFERSGAVTVQAEAREQLVRYQRGHGCNRLCHNVLASEREWKWGRPNARGGPRGR